MFTLWTSKIIFKKRLNGSTMISSYHMPEIVLTDYPVYPASQTTFYVFCSLMVATFKQTSSQLSQQSL